MSRIPQPPSSRTTPRSPTKTPARSTSRLGASTTTRPKPPPSPTPAPRTLRPQPSLKALKPASPSKSPLKRSKPLEEEIPKPRAPPLSIREQIALRRAEAQKAQASKPTNSSDDLFESLEDATPTRNASPDENMLDFGRWSVKETIERARTSGAINIASRALPCLPSALFEIHLGITPEPLPSVPEEPPVTTTSSDDPISGRRREAAQNNAPSWYEAKDLEVIKAWSNEIVEIQPEISMFGSLKTIDLHNNKLKTLPDTFADLTALVSLDLSHNGLSSLPTNLFALPNLVTLNLCHNSLVSLPFFAPFSSEGHDTSSRTRDPRGDWYCEAITRATKTLPKLLSLDVSHNKLSSASIDHGQGQLPTSLTKFDLSYNPLGRSASLLKALSRLTGLIEIHCQHAELDDDSFPVDLLSDVQNPFPTLNTLDLEETQVTRPVVEAAVSASLSGRSLDFDVTPEPPRPGFVRVVVGKRVVREKWEIEAERRAKMRGGRNTPQPETSSEPWTSTPAQAVKEPWEIEAEQGLLTEGAKRRLRAAAAQPSSSSPTIPPPSSRRAPFAAKPKVIEKEPWEIEAEQGLLTAGGQRRARAAAAMAQARATLPPSASPTPPRSTPATSPTPSTSSALASPQYYTPSTQTLVLPPSAPIPKAQHFRSFSLVTRPRAESVSSDLALAIPTPSLPLAAIIAQPFSQTLRVLTLANRRMDSTFSLPADLDGPFLPVLEELSLEGCGLGNNVPVAKAVDASSSGEIPGTRAVEALLPLLARLFPSLRSLDLSYNTLTSGAFTKDALSNLVLASNEDGQNCRGLRQLHLRGNKLGELDGFQALGTLFKGNREVSSWKLEELDLRDNEINKLPSEMGLLPLDVFLVDGNTFRVPPRRVWEREGTKGLLSWLRGRVE